MKFSISPNHRHLDQTHGQIRLTLLAAILCIAALTWAFLRSAELSPAQHSDYTRQLRDLREVNALIDGELLANRLELVRNYDALTNHVTRSAELITAARQVPDYLPPGARQAIGDRLGRLGDTLARKADLIDRFKRDNAVLRNSQAYFPVAAAELLDRHSPPMSPVLHQTVGRYVREMLSFARTPSEEGALRIAGIVSHLSTLSHGSAAAPEIDNLLRHGAQITARLLDIDRLMQEIVSLDSRQQMDALFHSYSQGHAEATLEASRFRRLLYALALLLAGFLIWLFARLERIRRSLATAHAEVSARYAAQLAAEKQLSLHATVFHSAHDGITLTDAKGVILDVNPAFTRITGWEHDEVVGRNPRMFKSGKHDEAFYQAMWQTIRETGSWRGEIWNRNKHGEIYPELLSISAVRNPEGEITNYVAVFADIRRIKAQERQLTQLAYYDALTELPNRVLLSDRLNQGIAQARRANSAMAICYLDLDGFKPINDTWGHQVGDKVLIEIAGRLQSALRGGDTVARLGGDEFVLLLQGIDGQQHLTEAARRLLSLIALPLTQAPGGISISASMGITLFPNDESDPDTLLRHADQAMYLAKEAGKNNFHIFDTEQDKFKRSRQDRFQRIEQALENGEFILHFQPKVDLRAGEVVGAEALIRWQHPERGLLPPADFLPLIEDDDLIKAVGDWVIESTLTQMEVWRREGFILPVSVNVAARQLQSPEFVEKLKAALYVHPDVACHLELEILETAALEDIAKSSRVIDECRMLGIRFALDDFGTGYSSLTYLKRLPAETIKIDQSFVREIVNDTHSLVIVQSVIGLARSFQREVVAEGLETVEHGRLLLQLGCDKAQGYGIARPMLGDDFVDWARAWRPPEEWQSLSGIDWHDAVYPMLIAETTHRSWVELLSQAIATDQPIPHQQLHDARFCQFGRWLASEGAKSLPHTRLPAFLAIDAPHRQVHALAERIDQHWRAGDLAAAKALLPELWAARDAVLKALRDLQIAISTNRPAGE